MEPELPEVGDRIRLVKMGEDPAPMEPGATGTVTKVLKWPGDGDHQITVDWDPEVKRSLRLVIPPDEIEILH